MEYWAVLFTGTTWREFQGAGSCVVGFRPCNAVRAKQICVGDLLMCYMVGVKRWVGLLKVAGTQCESISSIWQEEEFPVRLPVQPTVMLNPEHGVPMDSFRFRLSFYGPESLPRKWSVWVRRSPTHYRRGDGEIIAAAIRDADANPVYKAVNSRLLNRAVVVKR